jgi:hypothetical protein
VPFISQVTRLKNFLGLVSTLPSNSRINIMEATAPGFKAGPVDQIVDAGRLEAEGI